MLNGWSYTKSNMTLYHCFRDDRALCRASIWPAHHRNGYSYCPLNELPEYAKACPACLGHLTPED